MRARAVAGYEVRVGLRRGFRLLAHAGRGRSLRLPTWPPVSGRLRSLVASGRRKWVIIRRSEWVVRAPTGAEQLESAHLPKYPQVHALSYFVGGGCRHSPQEKSTHFRDAGTHFSGEVLTSGSLGARSRRFRRRQCSPRNTQRGAWCGARHEGSAEGRGQWV